ncbi:elongation factor 1-delta [Elysia marginata]|uniref:Elongation factor 1-delta n=1 Tax=Elysia marginata TaxID=1093978 RepID=A0AAV4I6Q3_9GAST|nr:elongation factor 1-delta [Elysia marginata]
MANPLLFENVWLQQQKFEDAERLYQQLKAGTSPASQNNSNTDTKFALAGEIAQVREDIQKVLSKPPPTGSAGGAGDASVLKRLEALEKENKELRKITNELRALILTVQSTVNAGAAPAPTPAPASSAPPKKPAPVDDDDDDDDDDEDLFGSDDEEMKAIKEKRLADYAAKKAKKPTLVAKSSIVLDVKPWDDETDMKELERLVRSIEQDGLVWGASKLVEVGYGIKKLQIICVVEDDKVSVDDLSEKITEDFEDHCQSVDVAAFNKI